MPCLFFRNVPDEVEWDPSAVNTLYCAVAEAAGCSVEKVEVHIEDTHYQILRRDGTLDSNHGVHVFVEWFEGRTTTDKYKIARAIQRFLEYHYVEEGSDVALRGYPLNAFYFEGVRVGDSDPPVW